MKKLVKTLFLSIITATLCASVCFAESSKFEGSCEYKNGKITSSFDSDSFAASLKDLEPGDTVDYTITYKNGSSKLTRWYMKNSVLETLEENSKQAENGGYTYTLKNIGPDKKETVLFDNSKVGGENVTNKLQGLKQVTNATGEYFFIQNLKAGQTGTTTLHIEFDGETEVNDYMDTHGALMVSYAVEKKGNPGNGHRNPPDSHGHVPNTGDQNRLLFMVLVNAAAVVLLIAAIILWRRNKREEDEEA